MYLSEVYGKGGIYAKCVSASSSNNINLYTLELNYPRFIHSQFMTHRQFSRNASSSRAIPVEKMIEQVESNPARPIYWGSNKPGMQAEREINIPLQGIANTIWDEAAVLSAVKATNLKGIGLHKQIVNRLLEPFQFIRVVCTATEWDNFFSLRIDDAAQPEIQELAGCMKEAIDTAEVSELLPGEYHLPYVTEIYDMGGLGGSLKYVDAIKASIARCARVSYLNHDNTNPDIEKDIALHDMLLEHRHLSPFEHVATPMRHEQHALWPTGSHYIPLTRWQEGVTHQDKRGDFWSGNFRGWVQYRQLI